MQQQQPAVAPARHPHAGPSVPSQRPAPTAPQRPAVVPFWQRPGFNPWEGCSAQPWWLDRQRQQAAPCAR